MICILYTIALGTCLAIIGVLAERVWPESWPRRWIWCAAIGLSITIPPIYQAKHFLSLGVASGRDTSWITLLESRDPTIMRLWLIGTAGLLIWALFDLWRVSRAIGTSRNDTNTRTVVDGVPVLLTRSAGPATVGVWRSRVVIPRWVLALPAPLRQYVIKHEDEHRRAHDAQLLFFTSLTLIVVPWNIALWWQLRRLSLAAEMDCDDRVVNSLGDAGAYGELLLKVAEASSRGPRLQPGLIGGRGLERRLARLLAPARLTRLERYLLPLLAIALLVMALAMPHPVSKAHHGPGSHARAAAKQ